MCVCVKLMKMRGLGLGMRMRLPPGFRFEPTEEELVFEYLKCKVFSSSAASIIPEINLCNFDPWDLPGDDEEEIKYLFCKNIKDEEQSSSPSGYWKAGRSSETKIVSDRNLDHVGIKKTLFFRSRSSRKNAGCWVMHQYCLTSASASASAVTTTTQTQTGNNNNNMNMNMKKWVLCRIFCSSSNNNNSQVQILQSTAASSSNSSCSSSSTTTQEFTSSAHGPTSNSDDDCSAS